MSDETKLWTALNQIHTRLLKDKKFEASFAKNPATALRAADLDAEVPATTASTSVKLSTLLGRMTDLERRATIESVAGTRFDSGRVALALANANAVANANAGANANALANANANANANSNTNTNGAGILRGDLIRVQVGDRFAASDLGVALATLRLSPARQAALIKSVFSDSTAVTTRERTAKGEMQKAIGTFRGVSFEIEALVVGGEIAVQSARVIR